MFLLALALAVAPQIADPAIHSSLTLMPWPDSVSVEPGRLPITPSFLVAVPRFRDGRLLRAVSRSIDRLGRRTGLVLSPEVAHDSALGTLVVVVRNAGEKVQSIDEDETYSLDVTATRAVLRATTVVGALRGLETFQQLVTADSAGFSLPLVHIADRPRFAWRGLLIDVSRHFEPVEVIERNLDAMAAVKLNVLHWHLSDDQGFRVESKRFPRLQQRGSNGEYYTQAQIREVVAYARDRGIRVVPEFDMPGHSISWFAGYPQYASAPGPYTVETEFHFPAAAFDPTRASVYTFIDRFVGEMATLFPDSYWHVGGDEVDEKAWMTRPVIRRYMWRHHMKDAEALQAYFNRRLARILKAHHKRMIGWDEIMQPGLPHDVIVQSWRGQASLGDGARQGYYGILSAGYYLDAMSTAAQHYAVDPVPEGSDLDATQAAHVLGGEACMWGELVTPETIDSRIWPRTAAIAERLWSPREVTDVNSMYRRLAATSIELERIGTRHVLEADVLWRRIAGTDQIGPLRALANVLTPVTVGQRMRLRRPTTRTPLEIPGDFVRPDAGGRRALSALLDTLLDDSAATRRLVLRDSLAAMLAHWHGLAPEVSAMRSHAPLLADADSAAQALAVATGIGEQALAYLDKGRSATHEWTTAMLAQLDSAATPHGLLRVTIVPPLRRLVLAAGGFAPTTGK